MFCKCFIESNKSDQKYIEIVDGVGGKELKVKKIWNWRSLTRHAKPRSTMEVPPFFLLQIDNLIYLLPVDNPAVEIKDED
jgi:hypothetical protein